MMKRVLHVFALVVFSSSLAHAAEKVALLIGNNEYESAPALYNPVNDVRLIDEALRSHGFDVTRVENQNLAEMNRSLRRFRAKADAAEVAMIYYAGHGIEIGGVNYLIPTDAELLDERDAPGEAVTVASMLEQISGAGKLKLMVLDACRDNPFADRIIRDNRGRNVGRGLARTTAAASDTLVAYAAAAGAITSDGPRGGNSPFTAAFAKALSGPARDVRLLFGSVRDIMRSQAPQSEPFVYTSLGGSDYLIQKPTAPQSAASDVGRDYQLAERIGTAAAWEAFLAQYRNGGGLYVSLAEAALTKIRDAGSVVISEPVVVEEDVIVDEVDPNAVNVARLALEAEAGSVSAMAQLGWAYLKGIGAQQNGAEAIKWYKRAAELGDAQSMHNLGIIYYNGEIVRKNGPAAIEWHKKAIAAGENEAFFSLGLVYFDGNLVDRDAEFAFSQFSQGANLGDPASMFMLALMYDEGDGVDRDPFQAAEWLTSALDRGDEFTLNELTTNAYSFSFGTRKRVQTHLQIAGFYDGDIDGAFGPITRSALTNYFEARARIRNAE